MSSVLSHSFDWPPAAAGATEMDAEETAAHLKQRHKEAWMAHARLMRFLEDHYPAVWSRNVFKRPDGQLQGEGVAWCRTRHTIQTRKEDGAELVRVVACGERPFCPACNDEVARRRGRRILRKVIAATPPDEDVTAYLVTMGVSEQDAVPTGRVALVTRDWQRFKHSIHGALRETFGPTVGAFTTYQEYGQSVLVKPRPHVHALIHNWRPTSSTKYRRTPMFMLDSGGKAKLEEIALRALNKAFPDARGPAWAAWGTHNDLDIRWRDTPGKVAKSCKYLVRELIDLRTLEYDRSAQTLRTIPYSDAVPRRLAPVATVKHTLVDYAIRTGGWYTQGRRPVDSAIGCMSDNDIGDTIALMGRHEEHREGCWCKECSTWERAWGGDEVAPPLRATSRSGQNVVPPKLI